MVVVTPAGPPAKLRWRHPGAWGHSDVFFLKPGSRSDVQCCPGSRVITRRAVPPKDHTVRAYHNHKSQQSNPTTFPSIANLNNLTSAPRGLIFHMRLYFFAFLVIRIIKESSKIQKFAKIDQTGRPSQLRHSFKVLFSSQRAIAGPQIWRLPAWCLTKDQGPCPAR